MGPTLSTSKSIAVLGMLVPYVVLAGCCKSVLTNPQVDAVQKFAEAAKSYGTLPGASLDSYSNVVVTDRWTLFVISQPASEGAAEQTFNALEKAREFRDQIREDGNQVDASLAVLDNYAALLNVLSSNKFTDALTKSATDLSASLDSSIDFYNKTAFKDDKTKYLPDIGSSVAEVIRAAGGIYIRCKQEQALQHFVPDGDKIIQRLAPDIEALMDKLTKQDGLLDKETEQLRTDFKAVWAYHGEKHALPFETLLAFQNQLDKISEARGLAIKASSSAKKYASAHKKLAASIHNPENLKDVIDEIQALSNEISAARELKKTLDKKTAG